eukprot:c47013_g1_i1 orf=140-1486(+)
MFPANMLAYLLLLQAPTQLGQVAKEGSMGREIVVLFLLLAAFCAIFENNGVNAVTNPLDIQALMRVKAAVDPETIQISSCLGSWDFSLDPCDNRFGQIFTCGFDCTLNAAGMQRVTSLQFDSSGYRGTLSPFISNMTALQHLQVSGNALGGVIPDSIAQLTQLTSLDLSSNSITGRIPVSLGSLRRLEILNLANNLLEGSIPVSLNDLRGLTELRMNNNRLNGLVPALSGLKQLRLMDLSNNALSGGIPLQMPPSISSLCLKNNQLVGNLPTSVGELQELNVLDLSDNQLTGTVDASLFAHPSLQQVNLSNNRFTMLLVPDSSRLNSQMIALDLSYNVISGSLPAYFATMTKLSSLSLRNNFFTGVIPIQYALKAVGVRGGIEQLQRLMLDGNYLTGPLPSPFMNLLPGSMVASFIDNCFHNCPSRLFFCQGGRQKAEDLCRLFDTVP